jgi:hypothetical protein
MVGTNDHRDFEENQMNITNIQHAQTKQSEYFSRRDTPAAESPVGKTMAKVLAKYPGITFEEARERAQSLLTKAAASKHYYGPLVLSADALEKRQAASQAYWKARKESRAVPTTA